MISYIDSAFKFKRMLFSSFSDKFSIFSFKISGFWDNPIAKLNVSVRLAL